LEVVPKPKPDFICFKEEFHPELDSRFHLGMGTESKTETDFWKELTKKH
jgi:hypothetical protein